MTGGEHKAAAASMELLAPAGNMECLKAAVQSGADAVYFAGKQFGARSFAENFSDAEINEAAKYCRLYGVKSYVTVNTMTLDREFFPLDRFVAVLASAGVDGVIVQDLGVMERIHQICPELPLHASTQMTVHNLSGVRELEKLGASRVVLARELSERDMAYIIRHCQAEVEVFVHGAMCMSYSGQCLMSSVLGGRSGNRGRCAQPCRLSYHAKNSKEQFYLSLKDMSLLSHLKQLSKMGVASLKIEGRMKGPEYVSTVVGIYRRCLDTMQQPTKEELSRINRVFFRGGLTDGYFAGKIGVSMFAFDKPDNPYAQNTRESLTLEKIPERTVDAVCRAVFLEGAVPQMTLTGGGETVTCCGDTPLETAVKAGADPAALEKQLRKTGGTAFSFSSVSVEIKGNPFVPVKTVNALRRDALEQLTAAVQNTAGYRMALQPLRFVSERKQESELGFTASVTTREQFEVVCRFPFRKIDVPLHLVLSDTEFFLPEKDRILLNPPVIIPDSQWKAAMESLNGLHALGFQGLRAENIGILSLCGPFEIWGGHRLNLSNSLALSVFKERGAKAACLSAELNLAQIRDLKGNIPKEIFGYGHLPLMLSENCMLKNTGQCPCEDAGTIYDRKENSFPVLRDGESCRSILLNSVPLYMGDKLSEIRAAGVDFCKLFFTVEEKEKCERICRAYFSGQEFWEEYTRLHYYKGVQ